jgi:PKHD-type hydroxylase
MILELPRLLPDELVREIATALAAAPFDDGKLTARGRARDVKNNLQLDYDHPEALRFGPKIIEALRAHRTVKDAVLPHTVLPIRFCKYTAGMSYGEHVDAPTMRKEPNPPARTDLAMTLWLSPRQSYEGGELVIRGSVGERALKGDAGEAVIYPANTLHRVNEVTRGERLVAITWIQSLVRDQAQRGILFDLALAIAGVSSQPHLASDAAALRRARNELIRMWAST